MAELILHPNAKDLTGRKFGRLLAVAPLEIRSKSGFIMWRCQCECGAFTVVASAMLISCHTQSCGCLSIEKIVSRSTKHGHGSKKKPSPTYVSWCSMLTRCTNKKHLSCRKTYRDVLICSRWSVSFENFLADMGERPDGKTLDRINPFGNYEPSNCRWATGSEQRLNRRSNYHAAMQEHGV